MSKYRSTLSTSTLHCSEEAADRVPSQDPRCGGGASQEEEEAETAEDAAELEDSDTGPAHRLEIPLVSLDTGPAHPETEEDGGRGGRGGDGVIPPPSPDTDKHTLLQCKRHSV